MAAIVPFDSNSSGLMNVTFGREAIALPFGREIFLFETHVAGIAYHDADEVSERLAPELELLLVRRPENMHDSLAIEIFVDRKSLGFVPRRHNEPIARLMDAGKAFVARISAVNRDARWLEVRFRLFLRDVQP